MRIIGHKKILDLLLHEIKVGTVSPVYLFVGPQRVGKSTTARFFAENITKNKADIVQLDHDNEKKGISIKSVREFLKKVELTPLGSTVVGIIDDADQLTLSASNALLKTLEEHHARCVIILICHASSDIPKTILSRSRIVRFQTMTPSAIATALSQHKAIPVKDGSSIAELSNGRPGLALELYENHDYRQLQESMIKDFFDLCERAPASRLRHLSVVKESAELMSMIDTWTSVARDILLLQTRNLGKIQHDSARALEENIASKTSASEWSQWVRECTFAKGTVSAYSAQPTLVRDLLVLRMPSCV